jgi:hypothetical protein
MTSEQRQQRACDGVEQHAEDIEETCVRNQMASRQDSPEKDNVFAPLSSIKSK